MEKIVRRTVLGLVLAGLAACSTKFKTYRGPTITSVEVHKADRKMYLLHGTQTLKSYNIHLGASSVGTKHFEGDGKTPEGAYYITHRNPNSSYYLSLGISYPNDADRAFAAAAGKPPGGDIFIHGGPTRPTTSTDWTVGCIAVSNKEMEDIFAMVNPGTPINIFP